MLEAELARREQHLKEAAQMRQNLQNETEQARQRLKEEEERRLRQLAETEEQRMAKLADQEQALQLELERQQQLLAEREARLDSVEREYQVHPCSGVTARNGWRHSNRKRQRLAIKHYNRPARWMSGNVKLLTCRPT